MPAPRWRSLGKPGTFYLARDLRNPARAFVRTGRRGETMRQGQSPGKYRPPPPSGGYGPPPQGYGPPAGYGAPQGWGPPPPAVKWYHGAFVVVISLLFC